MNMVERFFRGLTVDVVRHGSFAGAKELGYAITNHVVERNLNPTWDEWRADGGETLAKIMQAREIARILAQRP